MSSPTPTSPERGFTLIEVLIALLITMIVMASVYGLLSRSQKSFDRESQVAEMQLSTRAGVQMITRDLSMAGYKTPPVAAVQWNDGGGIEPDEVTIVYADPDIPVSMPVQCGTAGEGGGGGPCKTIGQSSTLNLDPTTMDPSPPDPTNAYAEGMVLTAIETGDCNDDGLIGMVPFTLTQPPTKTSAGGNDVINVNHNPGNAGSELNPPGGFNSAVREDCAVVGKYRIISYRVSPPPPVGNPTLERRDLSESTDWVAVAHNIENLQVRYGVGNANNVVDVPGPPVADDTMTWINRVAISLTGRTERTNLEGASAGVFDADDTYIRKTVSSQVGLRNVVSEAEQLVLSQLTP